MTLAKKSIDYYKERTSSDFFVGSALGYARLEEEGEAVQTFNITVFYPVDETKPCYVPKLSEGQVLSIANSKFSKSAKNNELDIILTSATILDILPENLPVHQINVVGVAMASEPALITDIGIQIECVITDYLSKDKPTEVPITLFHPTGSRFMNQTTIVKRGSSVFFSGTLSSIEGKLYLELHNFSFLRGQQSPITSSPTKRMPWLNSLKSPVSSPDASPIKPQLPPTSTTNTTSSSTPPAANTHTNTKTISTPPAANTHTNAKTIHKNLQQPKQPTKRKTRSSFRVNKLQKLADIASDGSGFLPPTSSSSSEDEDYIKEVKKRIQGTRSDVDFKESEDGLREVKVKKEKEPWAGNPGWAEKKKKGLDLKGNGLLKSWKRFRNGLEDLKLSWGTVELTWSNQSTQREVEMVLDDKNNNLEDKDTKKKDENNDLEVDSEL
ncbi:hypothetical protein GLOIN_2v1791191 [Rhizophagus irregularis DAOM 181602=DAOM 197198]|nr:hypothetical protein GLOIN_2v1791191 [Rhizophagus irregularis DAOM 181602=DAOM 197198]